MVRRLGVVAGDAENVGYSPVPMGDMDIQWVLQSLSSEQSSTGTLGRLLESGGQRSHHHLPRRQWPHGKG